MEKLLELFCLNKYRRWLLIITVSIVNIPLIASEYNCYVDFTNVQNDMLQVSVKLPPLKKDSVIYYFPKVVPGTYSISDFGRFVFDFNAFDINGNSLAVEKLSVNEFLILNAINIDSLSYVVKDTWDEKIRKNEIFSPNGTGFQKDKYYMVNTGSVFGTVLHYENLPYNLYIEKNKEMYLTSTLLKKGGALKASDYNQIIDSPFLICKPDTASFLYMGTRFSISCYNESGQNMANKIMPEIEECVRSIHQFWGEFPVKEYTFIFYFTDYIDVYKKLEENPKWIKLLRSFNNIQAGALEHKNSSLYVLLNMGDDIKSPVFEDFNYTGFLKEVVIHEFMHTIAPIGVRSLEIGELNFLSPQMSQHLWFYEGITEYFAGLIMLQNNLLTMQNYFNKKMKNNLQYAKSYPYNKISITEMSRNVLEKKYNKHYKYVYSYGALLGLILDVEIIRLSNGEVCLKDIVKKFYDKYGYKTEFKDDEFINEFLSYTPEGLEPFFDDYILGSKKPNYNSFLNNLGINYYIRDSLVLPGVLNSNNGILDYKMSRLSTLINGDITLNLTSDNGNLKPGDILNLYQIEELLLDGLTPKVKEKDSIEVDVKRKDLVFKHQLIVENFKSIQHNFFTINEYPDSSQMILRNKWLSMGY